ncbi:hypothetical protein B566_EDAN014374 [Ephemera danica]|nr:hypothetical protein B566_EDAN014374 [Ephemera danica]
MVACDASSEVLTRGSSPPATRPKPSTSSSGGGSFPFRLNGGESAVLDRASSVITSSDQQSIYKQRIDAMFDETRSLLYGCAPSRPGPPNTVQVKIERMFQEVASSEEPSLLDESIEQNQQFKVHYLGNVALADKETTLINLQKPLKELYFKYLESELNDCKPPVSKLEISTDGLNVVLGNRSELNPFSTIAVWAAVKCVSKEEGKKLAFLPLIADPDGQDKSALYCELSQEEDMALAQRTHSPLLAVVMRHTGTSRQLFCHGYVCTCSEDAIVMAANLYQALMSNMKLKRIATLQTDKPVRPPRKPKSKTSSEDEEILVEPQENKTYLTHQRRISSSKIQDPTGDILTKIAIPRSRSFLMKTATRGGNSSLHDLFAEIRTQEGITNMDEVLEKIVNKNGMSFNDLKPLYKELLLKLAVTLTRDELYLRSKNIMKRQQKLTPTKRTSTNRRKRGFKYAFRRSVKKIGTTVTCHKQPPSSFEFTSVLFPSGKRRNSMASSYSSSYPTMRRRRAKKQKEAVESRLSSIANREIRRDLSPKDKMKAAESPGKRESSSGYVSCSECSLASCLCDTDSCLESDKCYCSLQNNKKHVVTSTSWRHHLNKPPTTHTSRSLQKLLEQPLEPAPVMKRRPSSYTSRMDVYDAIPGHRTGGTSISSHRSTKPKFSSVDNLALDYELFRYSAQHNRYTTASQQRVLVVSARDNRGRLIYMGAADRDKRKVRADPANEALAVKKSAEIASLFSDMKLSQTTNVHGLEFEEDRPEEVESDYHELEPPEHPSPVSRRGSYPGSALENSLGYLP